MESPNWESYCPLWWRGLPGWTEIVMRPAGSCFVCFSPVVCCSCQAVPTFRGGGEGMELLAYRGRHLQLLVLIAGCRFEGSPPPPALPPPNG